MAILVHHSFPDELEAANGVITGRFQPSGSSYFLFSEIITQLGATSVTNPDGNSIPEFVESSCYRNSTTTSCDNYFQERSSLLPLGQFSIMSWQDDYTNLNTKALEVAISYQEASGLDRYTLEFEFKKLTDGSLIIKQVRRVPEIESSGSTQPALVNRPVTLEVFQGEAADLFSNHNLKLHLDTETASYMIDPATANSSFIKRSDWLHHSEGAVMEETGAIPDWSNADFAVLELFGRTYSVDSWTQPDFKGGSANLELRLQLPSSYELATQPITTAGDLWVEFHANFSQPQLTWDYHAGFTTTTSQVAILVPSVTTEPLPAGSTLQTRKHQDDGDLNIEINFYWPPAPTGPIAGYTAPLQKWDVTTITGLTTSPIELRGYFSQTYRPGHHNFTEEFLLEPRLESGIDTDTLDELAALDIKQFYLLFGGVVPTLKVIGFDDEIRDLN